MSEVQSVEERCKECGIGRVFLIFHRDLDEDGLDRVWSERVRVPHSAEDCERFKKLERETWPTLW